MITPFTEVTSAVLEAHPFTDHLWIESAELRESIDSLEFLRLLGDGTLPLEAFRTYLEQDKLYLLGYAKALGILASKAPDAAAGAFWSTSAAGALDEMNLHDGLLAGDLLSSSDASAEHSSACLGYVSYLIATAAVEPYEVAAAAVLPCFWVYADVGARLASAARGVLARDPEHPYARWVAAYDSEDFRDIVTAAKRFVDDAAAAATEAQRADMTRAFLVATRYESMFWDTALHPSPWPATRAEVSA